jgi:hypothetical protein
VSSRAPGRGDPVATRKPKLRARTGSCSTGRVGPGSGCDRGRERGRGQARGSVGELLFQLHFRQAVRSMQQRLDEKIDRAPAIEKGDMRRRTPGRQDVAARAEAAHAFGGNRIGQPVDAPTPRRRHDEIVGRLEKAIEAEVEGARKDPSIGLVVGDERGISIEGGLRRPLQVLHLLAPDIHGRQAFGGHDASLDEPGDPVRDHGRLGRQGIGRK